MHETTAPPAAEMRGWPDATQIALTYEATKRSIVRSATVKDGMHRTTAQPAAEKQVYSGSLPR